MGTVPRVPPFDRPATYDDLVNLPDLVVAEIVNGELHASPRPRPSHAIAYAGLGALLSPPFPFGRGGPGGWWILSEPELHFGDDTLVPDLAGWRRHRMPVRPPTAYFPVAPDWVCEIVSPSTAALDRGHKLGIYAREGVPYAWLVDPDLLTLEVLQLHDGRWTIIATHAGRVIVRVEPFEAIALALADLWDDDPSARSDQR
jgi:Uma2 family endonuclease